MPILSRIASVGADDSVRPEKQSVLLPAGQIVEACIRELPERNPGLCLENHVVMPNHVHLLLRWGEDLGGQSRPPLQPGENRDGQDRLSLQKVIQGFKSVTTRKCWPLGIQNLWQRSFYDHVVRYEDDFQRIWRYIDENPLRWREDVYFDG